MDKRLTDFGKPLDQPFEIHRACGDCANLRQGCGGWPATMEFTCPARNPRPDNSAAEYRHKVQPRAVVLDGLRLCRCGADLPPRRRLCDQCKAEKRRKIGRTDPASRGRRSQ